MTPEAVCKLVGSRPLARHFGQVFFTVYDPDVAAKWQKRGATLRSDTIRMGYVCEVHLHTLLDEPDEYDDDGTLIDNRRDVLLSYVRERDGFALPCHG